MKILKKIILKFYHLISFLCLFILFIPNVNATEYTYDINLNDNGKSMEVVFNGTKPIVWKSNIVTGSYDVTMNHSTGKFDLNSLQTYAYFDILYTTDVLDGFVNANGGQGAFASGEYNPVCIDSGEGPLKTCVIQIPVLRNSANYSCNGFTPDSLCTTDDLNLTFYNWSDTSGQLNIYGGYFTNNFVTSDKYYLQKILSAINQLKIDEQIQEQKETNQKLDDLKDSITSVDDTLNDGSVDSSDDTINNLNSKIPTNSVISDLLLLPVRFLQNFVNALGSSCTQFSLGSLYGTDLFMPCINIANYLGSSIWTTIDLIISGLFIYALRKKFIEIYENLTNLKNGGNEVD